MASEISPSGGVRWPPSSLTSSAARFVSKSEPNP
jgi:hypothetical protein